MNDLEEFQLGDEAKRWIAGKLATGYSLSRALLRHVDWNEGDVITYAPSGIDEHELLDFESSLVEGERIQKGRATWERISKLDAPVIARVVESLNAGRARSLILEDATARPRDPALAKTRTTKRFLRDEVYHVASAPTSAEEVADVLKCGALWLEVAVLTQADAGNDEVIEESVMDDAARDAAAVLVGAYDCEGYLVWVRRTD